MNTVDCRSLNGVNVLAILRFGGGITKIINIHLEELGGRPCSALHRDVHYWHGIFNAIMWEVMVGCPTLSALQNQDNLKRRNAPICVVALGSLAGMELLE